MAITAKGLQKLGFVSNTEFVLSQNGNEIDIEWLSATPQPTLSEIEAAHAAWQSEQDAKQGKIDSAKSKLESLGLTADEVKEAFGI